MAGNKFDLAILQEKTEILHGSRAGGTTPEAAVRIEDVNSILQLSQQSMTAAKAVGAAPTKAEYDALLADVSRLRECLVTMAQALQERLL